MNSEPVHRVPVQYVGGPADGQIRDVPVTLSGYPASFVVEPYVQHLPKGGVYRAAITYRLESAQKAGDGSLIQYRYVTVDADARVNFLPDTDWDAALAEVFPPT